MDGELDSRILVEKSPCGRADFPRSEVALAERRAKVAARTMR
jgi:hypothetical protein